MAKRETNDEGNSHSKPLEHVSQGPDCKCTRIRGFDDGERIESYGSHEHLKRLAQRCDKNRRFSVPEGIPEKLPSWQRSEDGRIFPNQTRRTS